ncbi:MAG: helix-turn-helix domain-containing protein [Halodesulfurarchaeum sp.]
MTDSTAEPLSLDRRTIQVEFEIEQPPGCPLAEVNTDIGTVAVDREGDTCRCDLVLTVQIGDEIGSLIGHLSSEVERCACTVFDEFNCVPEIVEVTDTHFVVRTFVDESTNIDTLLKSLQEVCKRVTLKRVTPDFDESVGRTVKDIDVTDLTEKQRDAMETAVRKGYYARPRKISLSELAEEFDISQQALAQRLARAEEKVMDQLIS